MLHVESLNPHPPNSIAGLHGCQWRFAYEAKYILHIVDYYVMLRIPLLPEVF